jgi:ornithine cyclodeaminase
MNVPTISFAAGEAVLDWIALTDALAAGHDLPKAEVADSFLYRGRDTLLTRSAWIDSLGIAIKAATIFPDNPDRGLGTVNGMMSLLSDTDGTLEAMIDFRLVTKWKTAADSLLAARRLARPDSNAVLIIGAGTVAASLIEAYSAAFPDAQITLWNRTTSKAQNLAAQYPGTQVTTDLPTAVSQADIIACATSGTAPVLRGDWLRPGQHVDLIGAYRPDMREADDTALQRANIFVDSRDTTLHHIGEIALPLSSGAITQNDIRADFYELRAFTRAPDDITLFKNGGGAHLDLMTGRHILTAWKAAQ